MIDPKTLLDEEVTITSREFQQIDEVRRALSELSAPASNLLITGHSMKDAFAAVLTAGLGVVKVSDAGDGKRRDG